MRPARVLVRVEALAEALERLTVRGDVGELGGGRGDDRVEAGEEGAADGPGQRPEPRRLGKGHVAVRQGAGQAQDVGDGVQQQVRSAVEAGAVDDGAVLPDRDLLGLGAVGAVPGEHAEVAQAVLAQRGGTARQGQVQGGHLVVRGAAQVQDGHAVPRGGDQLVVRGEHLLVRVPVVAVRREGQQVDDTGPELVEGACAGGVVGERLADALHPEVERVRHVGREIHEVDAVPDVVADHRAHGVQCARRGVEDRFLGQAREALQQLPRELEAHGQQRGVELPRRGTALPGGPGGGGEAVGVPDDQGFETVGHPGMIPDPPEPTHTGFEHAVHQPTGMPSGRCSPARGALEAGRGRDRCGGLGRPSRSRAHRCQSRPVPRHRRPHPAPRPLRRERPWQYGTVDGRARCRPGADPTGRLHRGTRSRSRPTRSGRTALRRQSAAATSLKAR